MLATLIVVDILLATDRARPALEVPQYQERGHREQDRPNKKTAVQALQYSEPFQ